MEEGSAKQTPLRPRRKTPTGTTRTNFSVELGFQARGRLDPEIWISRLVAQSRKAVTQRFWSNSPSRSVLLALALPRACLEIESWVAQATGLCRPATRRTECAGHRRL